MHRGGKANAASARVTALPGSPAGSECPVTTEPTRENSGQRIQRRSQRYARAMNYPGEQVTAPADQRRRYQSGQRAYVPVQGTTDDDPDEFAPADGGGYQPPARSGRARHASTGYAPAVRTEPARPANVPSSPANGHTRPPATDTAGRPRRGPFRQPRTATPGPLPPRTRRPRPQGTSRVPGMGTLRLPAPARLPARQWVYPAGQLGECRAARCHERARASAGICPARKCRIPPPARCSARRQRISACPAPDPASQRAGRASAPPGRARPPRSPVAARSRLRLPADAG